MKKRKKVVQGGSSAGKTVAILSILIDKCIKTPGLECSVVSQSIPHLKRGAYKDFINVLKMTKRYKRSQHTYLRYEFKNGSYVEFFSVEDEDKVLGARRHILYINEANRIKFDTYHQLAIRTEMDIYIDFNPTKKFWAHKDVITEDDADFIVLTYKDNEARPKNVDADMQLAKDKHDRKTSPYWINYWKVYGLGQIGALDGCVFTDWEIIPELPRDKDGKIEAELIALGTDFGYTAPSAVVAMYKHNGRYIWDEWVYDTKLSNKDIADGIHATELYNYELNWCDSAEPKSIADLQSYGINAEPCGAKIDIRDYAIKKLNEDKFYVTASSKCLISDLEQWVWMKDKSGEDMGKPMKKHSHGPEAMLYCVGSQDKFTGQY